MPPDSSSTQKLTNNLAHSLADCHIYGPAGAGNPTPDPADPIAYTMVPYEAPATDADGNRTSSHPESPPPDFLAATAGAESGAALLDQQEVIHDVSGDVFDDQVEVSRDFKKEDDVCSYCSWRHLARRHDRTLYCPRC